MKLLKSMMIAFSLYSKIPVPQFEWKEEDMQYMLCFFPWVGALIGGCVYLWSCFCRWKGIQAACCHLVAAAIPLILTGGFHADGFMDTMDAFHSYQTREKKLEILKDSHVGAFAVIMLITYGLIYLAAFSEITDRQLLKSVCAGFFLSRCLSGISVVSFPAARQEGILYTLANSAAKRKVKGALYLQGAACIGYILLQAAFAGAIITVAAFLAFAYYDYRSRKELGGITGDLAGYFILLCEGSMVVTAAVINVLR